MSHRNEESRQWLLSHPEVDGVERPDTEPNQVPMAEILALTIGLGLVLVIRTLVYRSRKSNISLRR